MLLEFKVEVEIMNQAAVRMTKEIFKIVASPDEMQAVIPKGTPMDVAVVKNWQLDDFKNFLKSNGIAIEPDVEGLKQLKRVAVRCQNGTTTEEQVIAKAISPTLTKEAYLVWLAPDNKPKDLVQKGIPFAKVFNPEPPKPGKTVLGNEIPAPEGVELPPPVVLDPHITLDNEGRAVCSEGGQVKFEKNTITFDPIYKVVSPGSPEFQQMEFFCDVLIPKELSGIMTWKIHGNLTVVGQWNAGNIEVMKDAVAQCGIQTNMTGVIKIHGNLKSNYIQMSKLGVLGNCLVENSILQSELRVGGDLVVSGNPGAVMATIVDGFGIITANVVGSSEGQATVIRLRNPLEVRTSKIGNLCKGSKLEFQGRKIVQQTDGVWEGKPGSDLAT